MGAENQVIYPFLVTILRIRKCGGKPKNYNNY